MKTSNQLLTGLLIFIAVAIFSFIMMGRFSMETFEAQDVQGNGEISEQYRQVPAFTGLKVNSGIEVELSKGENIVNLKAEGNVLEFIETKVENDILNIRWKDGTDVDLTYPINVKIAMPSLDYLGAGSAATVKTMDNFAGKNININISSGANVTLQGLTANSLNMEASSNCSVKFEQGVTVETKTETNLSSGGEVFFKSLATEQMMTQLGSNAVLKVSGSASTLTGRGSSGAQFKGAAFSVTDADLDGSSASHFEVEVSDNLKANLSSGSTVRYRGEANVNQQTSSGGSVRKVD